MLSLNLLKIVNCLKYSKKQRVPVSPLIFYQAVSKTMDYPQFIPWCSRSQQKSIISPLQNYTQLTISFKDLSSISYTSHVKMREESDRFEIISICKENPLKYLRSEWEIERGESDSTMVSYVLDFQFNSLLYQLTSSVFLNIMGQSMWDIFNQRAKAMQILSNKASEQSILNLNELKEITKSQNKSNLSKNIENQYCNQLSAFLEANQQIAKIYNSNISLKFQIDTISKRLSGTSNYQIKMQFQVGNLLSHYPK